jgi:transcriptional regulator with XRE-family HTH domain
MTQGNAADTDPSLGDLSSTYIANGRPVTRAEIGKCIKAHRLQRGWKLAELARKIDMDAGNMSRAEASGAGLTPTRIERIAQAFEFTIAELVENPFGPDWNGTDSTPARPKKPASSTALNKPRAIKSYSFLSDIPEAALVLIDGVKSVSNTAEGQPNWKNDPVKPVRVPGLVLRELRSSPGDLVAIAVSNDAMFPSLHLHDVVVVDVSEQLPPSTGGVFAVIFPGQPVELRRLFSKIDGGLTVSCDSKHYSAIELTSANRTNLQIIGRAKTRFGTGGL